jgi:predicted DNA-binding protein
MAKQREWKKITTMRLSADVLRRLDRIAEKRDCTRSTIINQFIAEGLKRIAPEPQPAPEPEVALGALD